MGTVTFETIVLIANIAFMPFVWTNPSMLPGAWAAANAGGTDAVLPAVAITLADPAG